MTGAAAADMVVAYEHDLAKHLGVEHVIAVSSGTTALHTALHAVGVGGEDEVLVPALSVVMSAAPVLHLGARPIIVDCDPSGTGFDFDDLQRKTTPRARAILPVHLWGRADPTFAQLRAFAADRHLPVIVDACQALGTTVGGAQIGLDATACCFSTHELKLLSTGEGGFIATNDAALAEHARAYRSHWITPPTGQRPLSQPAHNFRLAAALAAIGRRELAQIDALQTQRREQTALLTALLAEWPQLRPAPTRAGQCWNAYSPIFHLDLDRPRAFGEHLARQGVPNSTGTYKLIPLDERAAFTDRAGPAGACVNAASFLDGILAVALTRNDDTAQIRRYAATTSQEVTRWAGA